VCHIISGNRGTTGSLQEWDSRPVERIQIVNIPKLNNISYLLNQAEPIGLKTACGFFFCFTPLL
jgi:hypothetical protein